MNQEKIRKKNCPFVRSPSDDCYCAKLDSQNIENVLYYCADRFLDCEIYKKLIMKQRQPTNSNV